MRSGLLGGWIGTLLLVILAGGCAPVRPASVASGPMIEARNGVVVSVSLPASEIGRDVMEHGGNAVDAAVATAFALAVTWPEAGNIGGGGFMLINPHGATRPIFIDYRETAPVLATSDLYASGKKPSIASAGVPGTVRGLAMAHAKYGRLPWRDLILPAIKLADAGFTVDSFLADSMNLGLRNTEKFPEMQRVLSAPGGAPWKAGDRLMQKDLAATLRRIAENGPDEFYKGKTASLIVDEMKRGGGLILAEDLARYRSKEREPVHGTYRGYDVYSSPPPSSGGTCLILMLNILENFELKDPNSPQTLHLMIEAMRRAYADRAHYIGDPDYNEVPVDQLTSKQYAKDLAATIDPNHASRSEQIAPWAQVIEGGTETTHFSVVDKDGMAVANTYTLQNSFGGKVMVPGAGFLLNDEMTDFNARPGITDRKGHVGTPANVVQPGKRPLSSTSPTMVLKDGKVVLITGSPGGRTIINTVLRVITGRFEFGLSLRDAVDAPRLHHQWFPDAVRVEKQFEQDHPDALAALRQMGHKIETEPPQGDANSIAIDPKTGARTGVADQRRGSKAAGY